MKWMKERDLLIAQTMAFVQSVTGKKPDADKLFGKSPTPATPEAAAPAEAQAAPTAFIPDVEALLADTPAPAAPSKPAPIVRPDIKQDFQSEIRTRVANFRANQERFNREREAYGSTTMAKVQASLRELNQPPRLGK